MKVKIVHRAVALALVFAIAIALLTVLAIAIPGSASATPAALRVATVNLLHGFDSEEDASTLLDRLALVAEALLQEEVDVVGVQEASITSYGGNVAQELASQLGFQFVYQRSNPNLEGLTEEQNDALALLIDFEEGSAILSRFPIYDSEAIDLPRPSPTENRIALRAGLLTPWGYIDAYVTHLTNAPEMDIKLAQAQALAEWITSRPRELPALLMGDFNALEGSPPIDLLTEEFVDMYRAVDPTGPGYTNRGEKRIDYLFLVPGQAFAGEVVEARVFLDAPFIMPDSSELWASDHFGVLAELSTTTFPLARYVPAATGTGMVTFSTFSGTIENLAAVPESSLPSEGKPNLQFPHGFFSFDISGLSIGETVVVTIQLPSAVPVGTQYWKYHEPEGGWIPIPMDSNDGDNVITIQLTDNGTGDSDPTPGRIMDDGGPGNPPTPTEEGCFIATAAYGSYLDSHVETLRDFRDQYLLTNPVGSALVSAYYELSPPLAEFIDDHPALKPIVRAALLPAVAMSTVAVSTTLAEKMAIVGSLALVSVALAVWLSRRRGKGVIS